MAEPCSSIGGPTSSVHASQPARVASIWGEGFADDGVEEFCRVSDWARVSADEYAIMFPLLAGDGALAAPLLSHLRDAVDVRRWRLSAVDGRGRVAPPRVAALHRAWFADDGAMVCLLRRLGLLTTSPTVIAREWASLALLEAVLADVASGQRPAGGEAVEAGFAFGSGIHPAYLWPEAAISADRGIAAAWLGHLDRGRAALMPLCVADYLLDVVVNSSGPRDGTMAGLAQGVMPLSGLRRAAEGRQRGGSPVVRAGRGRTRPASPVGGRAARSAVEGVSLERA